jgi:hypothetical protein
MSDHGVSTISERLREMKTAQEEILRADQEHIRKIETKADKSKRRAR